jgi:hypothetical protein
MFNTVYVMKLHNTAKTIQLGSSLEFASSHTSYQKPQKGSNIRVVIIRDHVWWPSRMLASPNYSLYVFTEKIIIGTFHASDKTNMLNHNYIKGNHVDSIPTINKITNFQLILARS